MNRPYSQSFPNQLFSVSSVFQHLLSVTACSINIASGPLQLNLRFLIVQKLRSNFIRTSLLTQEDTSTLTHLYTHPQKIWILFPRQLLAKLYKNTVISSKRLSLVGNTKPTSFGLMPWSILSKKKYDRLVSRTASVWVVSFGILHCDCSVSGASYSDWSILDNSHSEWFVLRSLTLIGQFRASLSLFGHLQLY